MSTVVLTLVVVGGSIAVAIRLAASEERKPATEPHSSHRARGAGAEDEVASAPSEPPSSHRARRRDRKAGAQVEPAVTLTRARPSLLVRARAAVTLVAVTAMVGAAIALGILAGATFIGEALERAVQ